MSVVVTLDGLSRPALERIRSVADSEVQHCVALTPDGIAQALGDGAEVGFTNTLPSATADLTRLRWLHIAHAGIDEFANQELMARHDLVVTTSSGLAAPFMAQYALAAILCMESRILTGTQMKALQAWPRSIDHLGGGCAVGKTIGLVGFGSVGRLLALMATGLGMNAIASESLRPDRQYWTPAFAQELSSRPLDVELLPRAEMKTLAARSDYVVVSLPGTSDTVGLVDADFIEAMKPGALLVNVGRGSVLDEEALTDSLLSGHLGGAILDVTGQEPLPPDSPLYRTPNLWLTPHVSGFFDRYSDVASELFIENLRRWQAGNALLNVFDTSRGY